MTITPKSPVFQNPLLLLSSPIGESGMGAPQDAATFSPSSDSLDVFDEFGPRMASPTVSSPMGDPEFISHDLISKEFSNDQPEPLEHHAEGANILRSIAEENRAPLSVGNTYTVLEHASLPISLDNAFRTLKLAGDITLKTVIVRPDYQLQVLPSLNRVIHGCSELIDWRSDQIEFRQI